MKNEIKNLLEERVTSRNIVDNDIKHFQSFISKVTACNVQKSYKNFFSLTLDCLKEKFGEKRKIIKMIKIDCGLVSRSLKAGLIGRKGANIKRLEKSTKSQISLMNGIKYISYSRNFLIFKVATREQINMVTVQQLLQKHVEETEMDQKKVSMLPLIQEKRFNLIQGLKKF